MGMLLLPGVTTSWLSLLQAAARANRERWSGIQWQGVPQDQSSGVGQSGRESRESVLRWVGGSTVRIVDREASGWLCFRGPYLRT